MIDKIPNFCTRIIARWFAYFELINQSFDTPAQLLTSDKKYLGGGKFGNLPIKVKPK